MRALPLELFRRGLRCIREPERGAVVVRDGEAKALAAGSRGRRRSTALRIRAAPCLARTPTCPPTRRPRRPERAPRGRSSDVSNRSPSVRVSPAAVVSTILPSSPPLTMRAPSPAVARMAPPCTSRRRASPFDSASTMASSPRTNAAVAPRKCAATIGPPAATGCVRSTTETMSLRVSVMKSDATRCLHPPLEGEGRRPAAAGVGCAALPLYRTRFGAVTPPAALRATTSPSNPPGEVGRALSCINQAAQLSKPSVIFSCGRLRPMKTRRLERFSSLCHGR